MDDIDDNQYGVPRPHAKKARGAPPPDRALRKREEYLNRTHALTENILTGLAAAWGEYETETLVHRDSDGEELPAIVIPQNIKFANLGRLRKFAEDASRYFDNPGALADAERRLAVISEAAEGGIITLGFDLDGGVHATVDEAGGLRLAVRNQGSVAEALDALARGEGIYANDVPGVGLVGFCDHDMDILARMHHMMGNALQTLGSLEWKDNGKLKYWTEQYDHFRALYGRLREAAPKAKGENLGTKICLRDVLRNVQATLKAENENAEGAIKDTIWFDDTTTLFDYMEMALAPEPTDAAIAATAKPAPRQQVGGRLWQLIDEYAQAHSAAETAAAHEALAEHIDSIGHGIEKPRAPQGLSPAMATPYGAGEAPAQVPEKLAHAARLLHRHIEAKYEQWRTVGESALVESTRANETHAELIEYLSKHLRSDLEIDFKNLTASMTVADREAGVIEVIIDTPPSRSFTDLSGKRFVRQELPDGTAMYVWDGKEPPKYDPNAPLELDVEKFLSTKTGRTSGAAENANNPPKSAGEYEDVLLRNLLAVIHKDGGQFTDQHGLITSCKSAEQKVLGALHQKQMLADTLGGILMASGMLRKDIDGLTGPQLVQFGEEFAASLERKYGRNTPTQDHLSKLIGICLRWKPRMGLTDNSPISMEIDAAVEHLKDWPRPDDREPFTVTALKEAEAGLEVAVGRLKLDGKDRGSFRTSEELALEIVQDALKLITGPRAEQEHRVYTLSNALKFHDHSMILNGILWKMASDLGRTLSGALESEVQSTRVVIGELTGEYFSKWAERNPKAPPIAELPLVTPEEFKADVDRLTGEDQTVELLGVMQANAKDWDAFGKLAAVPWAFIEYAAGREPTQHFEEMGGGCDGKHTDCGFCNHSLDRYGKAYDTGTDKHDPLCFAEFARKLIAAHPAPEVPAPVAQIKEPAPQVEPLDLNHADAVLLDLERCIGNLAEVKTGTKAQEARRVMQAAVRFIEGLIRRAPFGDGLDRRVVAHRFFKDLTHDERLKVFRVFLDNMQNVPDDEMQTHAAQRMLLNYLYEPPRGVEG